MTPTPSSIIRTYMALAGMYTLAASLIWGVNTLFLLEAGLSISEVFIANALFSVGMVVFEIPTGVVADTLGRRVSYLASVVVLTLTTAGYLLAARAEASLMVFGAVSILMGLGFTFYSGALEAWLVDALASVDGRDRLDNVFARSQQVTGAAMFLGTITGGLLGQVDLAVPFAARCILLVGVFAIAFPRMREIGFDPEPLVASKVPAAMRAQAAVGIAHGWAHPGLRLLMVAAAIRAIFFGWGFYAAQPYFLELLARDAVWIVGLLTAGVSLSTIVGNQIVDVVSRHCARRTTLLLWASGLSAVAAIVIGLTSSAIVAAAALFVMAAAMGVIMPVRQAYLHEVTASEYRATVVSFDAMVSSMGGVGGQVGLGAVADARGFGAGYVAGGAVTTLAVPVVWLLRRVGGEADRIRPAATERAVPDAGIDGSCPSGLPRVTGVESVPVGVDPEAFAEPAHRP